MPRNSNSGKKKIGMIGFPVELGADNKGVDLGPTILRYTDIKDKLKKLGYRVDDFGDIKIGKRDDLKILNKNLKYLNEIKVASEQLSKQVYNMMSKNYLPLILGGDHTTAIGSIAGISKYLKEKKKKLGVIWIDAHADMNSERTTPSGNIHGMPLAVSLGIGNKELTNIDGFAPKVDMKHIAMIGIRDLDKGEATRIKRDKPIVYTMSDVDKMGIHEVMERVIAALYRKVDHIHVSFDIDAMDPFIAPGTGTPVPGGFDYREGQLLMETLYARGCMDSLDMVEVNTRLDDRNKSGILASQLIASAFGKNTLFK
ncbi:MAG: arginase [Ignavibacteriae bacterium]|nr:arginase [Ignavibacteriota bacterium]MCB0723373.1 arginase [Ignavibacteriota bacterium]MCB9243219.1 arginase [Ignavibacteriales bacterium]